MSKSQKKIIVSYHGGCPDGMGAAVSAYLKFGSTADYIPVFHTKPFPEALQGDLGGASVYCLDYCPKDEYLANLMQTAGSVCLLDHHNGVAERVAPHFKSGALDGLVDESHSGAMLAWNWFFPKFDAPALIRYVEDRDLFAWKLDQSKEVCAALDTIPMTLDDWKGLLLDPLGEKAVIEKMASNGAAIIAYKKQMISSVLPNARPVVFLGHQVIAMNTHEWLAGEIGNVLAEGYDFSVIYYDICDQRKFSLRSLPGGANVREVCERLGGGGHVRAAGCSVALDRLAPDGMPIL
jgi:oligoribonuclease NrnB/cAMP/cGMP phosphodiesterase (DHH superfamily)